MSARPNSDVFPSGSPEERSAWTRRHPWRAGLFWGLLFNPPLVLLSVIWTGERGLWLGLAVAVVDSFTVGVLLKRQWTPPERGWMAAVLRVFGVRSG